jgi:hypothetical protein
MPIHRVAGWKTLAGQANFVGRIKTSGSRRPLPSTADDARALIAAVLAS